MVLYITGVMCPWLTKSMSSPVPSMVKFLGSKSMMLKFMATNQSAVPIDPPGWPLLAEVVILRMSRRTWVASC